MVSLETREELGNHPKSIVKSLLRSARSLAAAALVSVAVAGCVVIDSQEVVLPVRDACNSSLGSYALPKTLIRIVIKGDSANPRVANTALTDIQEISAHDRVHCLDYLASSFAHDKVKVWRGDSATAIDGLRTTTSSTQLLSFVSSSTIDYTSVIVRNIIRAIFIVLSRRPDFEPVQLRALKNADNLTTLGDYTFDPFDLEALLRVNADLRPLGYCVILETSAADETARRGPAFCGDPEYFRRERAPIFKAYVRYVEAEDAPARIPGILYRPRLPYRLYVYAIDRPSTKKQWRLLRTVQVKLENISPVISIGVSRAVFANRRTALLFDRGALVSFCVSKGSEVEGAVEIPLEVVRSIVALPTQIVMVRIDEATKGAELLRAERDLINVQQQYIDFLADPKKKFEGNQKFKALEADALKLSSSTYFNPAAELADFTKVCLQPRTASANEP